MIRKLEYIVVICLLILQLPIHLKSENNVHTYRFIEPSHQVKTTGLLRAMDKSYSDHEPFGASRTFYRRDVHKGVNIRWPPEWRPTHVDADPIPYFYDFNADALSIPTQSTRPPMHHNHRHKDHHQSQKQ